MARRDYHARAVGAAGLTKPAARCRLVKTADRLMKTVLALLGAAMLLAVNVFGQSDIIIKKHALELRDQNNVRQGVAPPTQPAQPATTPAKGTAPTPIQQSIAKLRADLTAIKANTPVTTEQKQQITRT